MRDYGVFRNEAVYTVYIDMTHSSDPAPSWTLQYSLLRNQPNSSSAPQLKITLSSSGTLGQLLAPFPITKEDPQLPAEVVSNNLGRLIVVYAEISSEGTPESLRIIQSPNPLLNEPLLEAIAKWTFRPAVLNGEPVAVKALFGIPLSLPH